MNGRRLLGLKLRTAWALRPLNIARVLAYRLSLKLKLNRAVRRPPAAVTGPFFRAPDRLRLELAPRRGWYQWREAFGLRVDDGADMDRLGRAESLLSGGLSRLLAVSENYPELKANQTMAELMEELSSTENRIGFARQAFNDAVMHYNTYREQFPNNAVSGLFGPFKEARLLEIENPEARQAVNVTF